MNKQRYIAPITEVIHCGNFCETLPVYWSQAGPGDVGAKEMELNDFFDKDFLPSEFNDVWDE